MKLVFTTEYNGTNFSGFQRQKNAVSIQQSLEEAIKKITKEDISINYAGRTDAGVHALCQVFDFETNIKRSDNNWMDGLNSNLPDSISIKSVSKVSDDFHSRFSAIERSYTFVIYNSKTKPLFFNDFSHYDNNEININTLKEHAYMFIGSHDFSSFRSSSCSSKNPIKNISEIKVQKHKNFILITITSNAFLHNMVRIMVGTLIDIAKGELNLSIKDILKKNDRTFAGKTASARGLFFLGPKYNSIFNIPSPTLNILDRFKI